MKLMVETTTERENLGWNINGIRLMIRWIS
jgi:hypothetical protein